MSMNPKTAKVGDRVLFAYPNAGFAYDRKQTKAAQLIVGNMYTLTKIEVHHWRTNVWLKGVEGEFNSVHFIVEVDLHE